MKRRNATFAIALCFMPARQDLVEKYGERYATSPDTVAYNGPFVLKEWKNEQSKLLGGAVYDYVYASVKR